MKKLKLMLIGILAFSALCSSCKKEELLPDFIYEMTLSEESWNVVAEGDSKSFGIESNYQWEISDIPSWCTVSKTSGGAGSDSFTINVEENTKIEERSASIKVTAGVVERQIKIVQVNPDGFEISNLPETTLNVEGLENVFVLQAKTNIKLEITSEENWVVGLSSNVVSGNPPKEAEFRVMFKDNTTGAPRTATVSINGEGLPASYAKTFTVTQAAAPAGTNPENLAQTWVIASVKEGNSVIVSLLGAVITLEKDGSFSETLPSGVISEGTWDVRDNRLGLYYADETRRYVYLDNPASEESELTGKMTPTDINSSAQYDAKMSIFDASADVGLTVVDKTNTTITVLIICTAADDVTEVGALLTAEGEPTYELCDAKVSVKQNVSVTSGVLTGLISGKEYQVRAFQKGNDIAYSEPQTIATAVQDLDGNEYEIVTIGNQTWFAQNLATTQWNDGTPIPYYDKDNGAGWAQGQADASLAGYCWNLGEAPDWTWDSPYNVGAPTKTNKYYGATYSGRLAVQSVKGGKNLCPEGWSVPTKQDFIDLLQYMGVSTEDFAGGDDTFRNNLFAYTPDGGSAYANTLGWNGWFAACRSQGGSFYGTSGDIEMMWWSCELDADSKTYPWSLYNRGANSGISWTYANDGAYIRCIRDAN